MITLALALTFSFGFGWLLVSLCWPSGERALQLTLLKIFLGAGIGAGVTSCLFFTGMIITGVPGRGLHFEAAALVLLALALLVAGRIKNWTARSEAESAGSGQKDAPLVAGAVLVLALALALFAFQSARIPHGSWDAWACWNVRASYILGMGARWREAFSPLFLDSNADYPPLLSIAVARLWDAMGDQSTAAPIAIAALFMVSAAGVLFCGLAALRSWAAASLGAVALLGTPYFSALAASQYADVPLSFFFLATVVLLLFSARSASGGRGFAALAGLVASLAAMTKNEGILFLVVASAIWWARPILSRRARWKFGEAIAFTACALPATLLLIYFKMRIAPSNYLVAEQGSASTLARLSDWSRYAEIWKAFVHQTQYLGLDNWGLFPILLPLYAIFDWVLGRRERDEDRGLTAGLSALIGGLMLAGYVGVYLVTPYNLPWHLDSSLGRLLAHLWPIAVFSLSASSRFPSAAAKL